MYSIAHTATRGKGSQAADAAGTQAATAIEVVYLAAPLTTFSTPRYDDALTLISEREPRARILSPRDLFTSNADWLRQWPAIRPTITTLYMLTGDGAYYLTSDHVQYDYIAAGCLKEWQDVTCEDGKPCILIDRHMTVHKRFRIGELDTSGRRWTVYTSPRYCLYGRSKKAQQTAMLRPRDSYNTVRPSQLDDRGV
jgi:hypothetical protein